MTLGMFYGVGVGPGPAGLIPVAAMQALQKADIILAPKAKHVEVSIARQCLRGLDIPAERIADVVYNMDSDRDATMIHYHKIAEDIAKKLQAGKTVAYLTIGDALTYSTYSYTLQALLKLVPQLQYTTFPGVTSFAAIAAALDFPLGQGKDRILILPCPETAEELRRELETHDIVVLMKIGNRLPWVLSLLRELHLDANCAIGSRIGLENEIVSTALEDLESKENAGYLTTVLIRCGDSVGSKVAAKEKILAK